MTKDRTGTRHVSVLFGALLVVYVLGYGPAMASVDDDAASPDVYKVVHTVYYPLDYLHSRSGPLIPVFDWYVFLWMKFVPHPRSEGLPPQV